MGRFKRHQRKHKGTETIVRFPRAVITKCDRANLYPRGFNERRAPEISDSVKKLLYDNDVHYSKPNKGMFISNLVGDLLLSIKKRGKYANLLKTFNIIDKRVWRGDSVLIEMIYTYYRDFGIKFNIGNDLMYYGKVDYPNLYKELIGRLILLNTLLQYDHKKFYPRASVQKHNILEYYAIDEIKKMNIKPLPNELVFACLFGTVFSLIGLIIIVLCLLKTFGLISCVIFLFYIGIVASIKIS